MEKSQQPPGIKLSPQEVRAITHPHLYGLALEGKEEEDAGPLQIVVNDLDVGDDLTQGIQYI